MKKIYTMIVAVMMAAVAFANVSPEMAQKACARTLGVQLPVKARVSAAKKAPKKASADLVTPPATATIESDWIINGSFASSMGSSDEEFATQVAFDGNDVYIQGLAYFFEKAWMKGTLADGKVILPSGQYVGGDDYGDEYMKGSNDGETETDIVFDYDAENHVFTLENYIVENDGSEGIDPWGYWESMTIYKGEIEVPEVVVPPAGLQTEVYTYNAQQLHYDAATQQISYTDYTAQVNVGFDGDDVYMQGLCSYLPEAWIKGTKAGDNYVFAKGQYFGAYYDSYDMFLMGLNEAGTEEGDVVMSYDPEANEFVQLTPLMINALADEVQYYAWYETGSTLNGPVTAVSDINTDSTVARRYVNLAGQESAVPFDGVNIELRIQSDGTTRAVKVVK